MLDNLLNKCFYIQVWGEQKHPKPEAMNTKISTKEYFEREKEINGSHIATNSMKNKIVDPEKQRLEEELHLVLVREKRNGMLIVSCAFVWKISFFKLKIMFLIEIG